MERRRNKKKEEETKPTKPRHRGGLLHELAVEEPEPWVLHLARARPSQNVGRPVWLPTRMVHTQNVKLRSQAVFWCPTGMVLKIKRLKLGAELGKRVHERQADWGVPLVFVGSSHLERNPY